METTTFPRIIDSTLRREFDLCQLRGYYGHFRHLRPKGENIHLHFGGCFARGLEVTRKAFYGKNLALTESLAAGGEAIINSWGDFEDPFDGNKSLETCLLALYEYFAQYPPDEDPIQPLIFNGEPAVEFTFALPIPGKMHPETGEPLLYAGRFDMLGSYGNSVWVVDEKTTSRLGASWAKQFKLASQMTGYVWASQEFGHPTQGAIIRGVGILKNSITHQIVIESRHKWMIERWLVQLGRDVDSMITAWNSGEWNMSLDHGCSMYGGCPFLTLCESNKPENWIETHYEVVEWSPLEKGNTSS